MVEALYFHAYYAYLLGDFEKTQMYYSMLKEEYNNRGNRDALRHSQLVELKNIREALSTESIWASEWIAESPAIKDANDAEIEKQKDLVKRFHTEATDSIRTGIEAGEFFELYNIEHPCGDYGRVDMVYKDRECIYPVEVKRNDGRHDLIGQISKYALFFKMRLHLKHYARVQPVTICRAYDRNVISELKRLNVVPLKYTVTGKSLSISKV